MKAPPPPNQSPEHERRDRLLKERVHDTYKARLKPQEPSVCAQCGAVFHQGRWQWLAAPEACGSTVCPACQRIQDKVPAGHLCVSGGFAQAHHDEIMNLIRHVEQHQAREHPLHRIMNVETSGEELHITFTDPHLARGVAEALHSAYQGEMEFSYASEEPMLRVRWRR